MKHAEEMFKPMKHTTMLAFLLLIASPIFSDSFYLTSATITDKFINQGGETQLTISGAGITVTCIPAITEKGLLVQGDPVKLSDVCSAVLETGDTITIAGQDNIVTFLSFGIQTSEHTTFINDDAYHFKPCRVYMTGINQMNGDIVLIMVGFREGGATIGGIPSQCPNESANTPVMEKMCNFLSVGHELDVSAVSTGMPTLPYSITGFSVGVKPPLFSDDFESGNLDKWTTSTTHETS